LKLGQSEYPPILFFIPRYITAIRAFLLKTRRTL